MLIMRHPDTVCLLLLSIQNNRVIKIIAATCIIRVSYRNFCWWRETFWNSEIDKRYINFLAGGGGGGGGRSQDLPLCMKPY